MKFVHCIIILIIIAGTYISCEKTNSNKTKLELVMDLLDVNPDSSYSILNQILLPSKMSQNDYALYCLLLTKAMEKTYCPLLSDSLINISLDYYKKNGNQYLLAESYFYAGRVNEEMQNIMKSIECYLNAINLLNDSDKNYKLLFLCHYYLGNLYSEQEFFDDELLIHKKAYYYSILLKDSMSIAYALQSIGTNYLEIGKKDSALIYLEKTLLWIHPSDSISLAYIFNNIGTSYDRLEKYNLALEYANRSEAIQPEKEEIYYSYILKGQIFAHINQYDSAKVYYNKSLCSDNLYTKAASYEGLADVNEIKRNYNQALIYRKKYDSCRDSIEQRLHTSTVARLQSIYQNEKLKDENQHLRFLQLEREQEFYKLCLIFALLILFVAYSYYKYRIKKEAKIQFQQKLLMNQQKEVQNAMLMQLETEQKLLLLQQKEIVLRENFFKRLIAALGLSFTTDKTNHIKLSSKDWNNIIETVNVAFDGFTIRLKKKYPELTDLDIYFCCLLKMNLTINELVAIYCLDKKSIYKKKERIKKDKMHLNDSRSLNEILMTF